MPGAFRDALRAALSVVLRVRVALRVACECCVVVHMCSSSHTNMFISPHYRSQRHIFVSSS